MFALTTNNWPTLPGPITRDPTGAAEFIDSTGQAWDVKAFDSRFPTGYNLTDAMAKINGELVAGERVILDTSNMLPAHIMELRNALNSAGIGGNVKWYP